MSYYGEQLQMPYQYVQPRPRSNTGLYISSSSFFLLIVVSIVLIALIALKVIVIPGLNSTSESEEPESSSGSTGSIGSTVFTVRERLDKLCPIDPAANGMINKTNQASRNDYLFSACTAAGTCDSVSADNISQILIDSLSAGGGGACGGWNQPEANPKIIWDQRNKRWNLAPIPAAVLTTKQRLSQLCPIDPEANGMIAKGNVLNRDDYLFSACNEAGTCNSATPDNVSQILINKLSPGGGGKCGGLNQPEINPTMSWDLANNQWKLNPIPISQNASNFTELKSPNSVSSSTGYKLVMQSDGNLVLYNPSGKSIWATNTSIFNPQNQPIKSVQNTGYCLDVNNGSKIGMYPTEAYQCNNGTNQNWKYTNGNLINENSGLCLDINKETMQVGQWKCHDTSLPVSQRLNQQWLYNAENKTLTSPFVADSCLDINGGAANGNPTTMYKCNGGENQKWTSIPTAQPVLGLWGVNLSVAVNNSPTAPFTASVSGDGNFCVRDSKGNGLWCQNTQQSVTKGVLPYRLSLQDDGNLCIYDSTGKDMWCSYTQGK